MKNITLRADEGLIKAAQRRAAAEGTTLDELFQRWLAKYVGRGGRRMWQWRLFGSCARL